MNEPDDPAAGRVPLVRSVASQARDIAAKVNRYRSLLAWIWHDALWRYRFRIAFTVGLMTGGLAAQAAVLGLVLLYAQRLESGVPFDQLGSQFAPRESTALLLAVGGLALILLLASAAMLFVARTRAIGIAREYEEYCSRRAFSVYSRSPTSAGALADGDRRGLLRLVQGDARVLGRVLRLLLLGMHPTVTAAVALGALYVIDPVLSTAVLALLTVSAVFLARVNVRGAAYSLALEAAAPDAAKEKRSILERLEDSPGAIASDEPMLDAAFSTGATKRALDAYQGRLSIIENGTLVHRMFGAVALVGVLLVQGRSVLVSGENWGSLIVYLVALRYFVLGSVQSARLVTSVNRFYPQVHRYVDFVRAAQSRPREPLPVSGQVSLVPAVPALDGSGARPPVLGRGDRVLAVSPSRPTRSTTGRLVAALGPSGSDEHTARALSSVTFATVSAPADTATVRSVAGLPRSYTDETFRAELRALGIDELLGLPVREVTLDRGFDSEAWAASPERDRELIGFIGALRTGAVIIVAASAAIGRLPDALQDQLADRIVILVSNDVNSALEQGTGTAGTCRSALVDDGTRVAGWAPVSWLAEHVVDIEALWADGRHGTAVGDLRSRGDDDYDDDEF